MSEDNKPYTIADHEKGARELVPDHPLEKWYIASWRSWAKGIKDGVANACTSLKQHWTKYPSMLFTFPVFMCKQIKIAIYLQEGIASRDYSELLDTIEWCDNTVDCVDELTTMRGGEAVNHVPLRYIRIQRAVDEYNKTRNPYKTSRLFSCPVQSHTAGLSLSGYADYEVEWGSDWRVFLEAAQGFFTSMSSPAMAFRVEAWSLMGMIAIYGSHPEDHELFCSEPVCLIPVEQFDGLEHEEMADLLTEALNRATECWHLNADSYYQQIEQFKDELGELDL